jgi:hypothetical protein
MKSNTRDSKHHSTLEEFMTPAFIVRQKPRGVDVYEQPMANINLFDKQMTSPEPFSHISALGRSVADISSF